MRRDGNPNRSEACYASDEPLTATAWLQPAAGRRGLVGIVDVAGVITTGDKVEVQIFEEPAIRLL